MKRCAYLTMADMTGFFSYDELTYAPLQALGWEVTAVPWRSDRDWDRFELVVIRTTWDYQQDPQAFLRVLADIDRSSARLENPLSLVRWNLSKHYLRELATAGILTVPTRWPAVLNADELSLARRELGSDELVVKPVIGANAEHAWRLPPDTDPTAVLAVYETRPCMIQPFLRSIVSEGEVSLFYFAGAFSHAIRKRPKAGDFRVQEEHGGQLSLIDADAGLRGVGESVIRQLAEVPLYARVDLVRLDDGQWALMELELIEPSLYFNMDPGAPARFARALDDWWKRVGS